MGRQKPTATAEFVLFDVLYEDGTITSHRKVPGSQLGGLDGDAPARTVMDAQDREIAERSGRTRPPSNGRYGVANGAEDAQFKVRADQEKGPLARP